jgi:hypothetical protein
VQKKVSQEKFIPVARQLGDDGKPALPVFFGSRLYVDFTDDDRFEESYDRLLRNLHGKPELVKPPLGRPPAHLTGEPATQVATAGRLLALKDAIKKAKPHADVMVRDYLDTFLAAVDAQSVRPKGGHEDLPFDERLVQALAAFTPYRDNFVEFVSAAGQYLDPVAFEEAVAPFFEQLLVKQVPQEGTTSYFEHSFDFEKFVGYELLLYLLAGLVQAGKTAAAARLIEGRFTFRERYSRQGFTTQGLDAFRPWIRTLEEHRKARLSLRWYSVTANLIHERATLPAIPFLRLAEVDFVLCIRPYFPAPGGMGAWYPHLAPYLEREGPLELFARATTPRGFRPVADLLQVSSLGEFVTHADRMLKDAGFAKLTEGDRFWHIDVPGLLNLESLRREVARGQ